VNGAFGRFGELAAEIAVILLVLNIALVVFIYWRRARLAVHRAREERVRAQLAPVVATVRPDATPAERQQLRATVAQLDRRSRPVAATLLLDRLAEAPADQRDGILEVLRGAGAIEIALRSARARPAWRRSLACATLGAARAGEALPVLEERLRDRNHHVREAAVEALGAIGDPAALPALRTLYLTDSSARPGIVYAALVALGPPAAEAFAEGIVSANPRVRTAACFGLAATARDAASFQLIERALADSEPAVRIAAADALATIGGERVPEGLLAAATDAEPGVRRAAVRALGFYDDRAAVDAAAGALRDGEREVALRAGEALVLLERKRSAGDAAARALAVEDVWPVQTARVLAEIGAL
jgi:HEAT repeat protein